MLRPAAIALVAGQLLSTAAAAGQADMSFVATPPAGAVVVDARPLERCVAASVPGARCLPAGDILGPANRLASFRDILWFLGTSGLTGEEHVVVVGAGADDRDFLAGVLHLAGQRRVDILSVPAGRLASQPGTARATTRLAVYQAAMRDTTIVTQAELAAMPSPALLDGRSDAEYWGAAVRAARGGHIAGADSLPVGALRSALAKGAPPPLPAGPIAYAHDAVEGIAYYAVLRSAGIDARVHVDGWAAWAADPRLPVDAATFPEVARMAPVPMPEPDGDWRLPLAAGLGGAVIGAVLVVMALRGRIRWT